MARHRRRGPGHAQRRRDRPYLLRAQHQHLPDARWGLGQETPGEEPLAASDNAVQYVKALSLAFALNTLKQSHLRAMPWWLCHLSVPELLLHRDGFLGEGHCEDQRDEDGRTGICTWQSRRLDEKRVRVNAFKANTYRARRNQAQDGGKVQDRRRHI
ncbi:hypothetical protein BHE74_00027665 [Ensete ventricosum]|nr:hypothetical protein GW17_00008348 [Ensete ventricosum]RWW65051.1 hypothetical protein BHE74_00027665 [Ensete ventricosum]RZR88728.1 hypothetical protein BHM03_00016358 [Ensete ventricosum]